MSKGQAEFEYIVVGSGAGGGTVAARLAEAGRKVLLLEAGGDPRELRGGVRWDADRNSLPDDYDVPVFHAISTESDPIRWDYWVRHYKDDVQQKKDEKYREYYPAKSDNKVDGVLYPRAGALGGCTAHNAQIFIYPHNKDWDDIADLMDDPTWKSGHMRKYLERMEDCYQRPIWRLIYKLTRWNPTRHGFSGWLAIEKAIPKSSLFDVKLLYTLAKSAAYAFHNVSRPWHRFLWLLKGGGDHNDWRLVKKNSVGIRYAPLTTHGHARTGTREFLLEVQRKHPDNLKIELDALVTRVILDDQNRARGVEYLKGARLYQAHAEVSDAAVEPQEVLASREVILAGGAFNTPQLLMLSGIGPAEALKEHDIPVKVDLKGVGKNLQDRYEVGTVYRMKEDWEILKGTTFARGDPQFHQWEKWRKGVYKTNGAVIAVIKRSDPSRPLPDLFCFATLGKFRGYEPCYSKTITVDHNYLSWIVLKAHTINQGGVVTLDPADPKNPRRRPKINFHYFDEGTDKHELDLESVVDGIEFTRKAAAQIEPLIEAEEAPGPDYKSRADLRQFVKDNAWGHHASCTCKIGPRSDECAVLDSNFRVYGTQGLRVVDASVFPRIPGFFIVSSVYLIGEKAADVILGDAGFGPVLTRWQRFWRCAKHWLRKIWKWLWRLIVALIVAILLIAGFSYFFYEPYSTPASNEEVISDIVALLRPKLTKQYEGVEALRDTHPKANACVRADFTIKTGLKEYFNSKDVERLSTGDTRDIGDIGIFANGGKTYTAWLRFSNAADVVTADSTKDFRGLAIKLVGVEGERFDVPSSGYKPPVSDDDLKKPELAYLAAPDDDEEKHTQDFLFVAHNTFFAGNAQHFHDFFQAAVRGDGASPTNPFVLWHFLTHPHGFWNTFRGRQVFDSIAEIGWFAVAPFKLGNSIVKYSALPCETQPAVPPNVDKSDPDYLRSGLRATLDPAWHKSDKGICLNFNVQFRVSERQPIDTTLVPWYATKEHFWQTPVSPWHTVARINIYPQEFSSPEQVEFCQNVTFNPWHSLKAHEPLEGLNIARRDVMFAMQRERLHLNDRKRFEPTGKEHFYPGAQFPWRKPPPD